jgi:hypothetical protein
VTELLTEIDAVQDRLAQLDSQQQRAAEVEATFQRLGGQRQPGVRPNPLSFTTGALDALQNAIDSRTASRIVDGLPRSPAAHARIRSLDR